MIMIVIMMILRNYYHTLICQFLTQGRKNVQNERNLNLKLISELIETRLHSNLPILISNQ